MTDLNQTLLNACRVYLPAETQAALALGVDLPESTRGSALFADISGFTPLTEGLTRALGLRRGAEELPLYLDRVYERLIAVVHNYAGSVVGFAGDAITCWFDDAPPGLAQSAAGGRRAAACALALQAAMQKFAAVPIPGQEPVVLALKVAVASGPARRYIVGGRQNQKIMLIAGDTITRMANAEHQAAKGETIFDQATVELLAGAAVIQGWREDGGKKFAVVEGLAPAQAPSPWPEWANLSLEEVRPWALPVIYQRLESGLGDFLTELRPATALFARFGGIDYEHDPQAGQKLDQYISWVQDVLARHEAVLTHPTIGDKGSFLCISFGAPLAHEDDTQRAAAAALALLHPPRALAFISPPQIGISQGTARTGSYGGSQRRTYDILGDQVNLAARLMVNARPGEILVSPAVAGGLEQNFELTRLDPIRVKGKSQPVAVARLEGTRPAGSRGRQGGLTPLFGRKAEVAVFEGILAGLRQRTGAILAVEGETGSGKTRLAEEFEARSAALGLGVLSGAGQSTHSGTPYAAWQAVFRQLLGISTLETENGAATLQAALQEKAPEWRDQYPLAGALAGVAIADTPSTSGLDARQRSEATRALAVSLLERAVLDQAVIILLDDAHWLDESSQELARDVGRVAKEAGIGLVTLQRPEAEGLSGLANLEGYQELTLAGLDPVSLRELVLFRLEQPAENLILDVVQALSHGNPHFALQLLEVIRESGTISLSGGRWEIGESALVALRDANAIEKNLDSGEWRLMAGAVVPASSIGLPDSVQGAMLARVDRLPETHKLTLRSASVLGRAFPAALLKAVHPAYPGDLEMDEQFTFLSARKFLQPNPAGYAFSHSALQEVLYHALPTATQQNLHNRAGTALETLQPEGSALLAYHYTRAGGLARPRALLYLDRAAAEAQRSYANATALNYYRQALSLEERWQWRKGQAEVLHLLGVRSEQAEAIAALENIADAPRADVYKLQYELFQATGDYPNALAAGERLLAWSREHGDRLLEAESLRQVGLVKRRQGDNAPALESYQLALSILEKESNHHKPAQQLRCNILLHMGVLLNRIGQYAESRQILEQALLLAGELEDHFRQVEILQAAGLNASAQKDFAGAQSYFENTIHLSRKIGGRNLEAVAYLNLAMVSHETGSYSAMKNQLLMALRLLQATGDRWNESNTWNYLGTHYQELGKYAAARECLEKALDLCDKVGDEGGKVYIFINLALVQRDEGDLEKAGQLLQEGLALSEKTGDAFMTAAYRSQMGILALIQSRFSEAKGCAEQALAERRLLDCAGIASDNLAVIARALLETGDPEQAADYARQTHSLVTGCAGEGLENPVQDEYGAFQVFEALGLEAEAGAALQTASDLLSARAAHIQEADLRQSFLQNVPVNRAVSSKALPA